MRGVRDGSPYAPHTDTETQAMLDAIGVDDVDALFDVPAAVRFDGAFGIDARSERETTRELADTLSDNDDVISFLGRGHYAHHVPAVVDRLSSRSEFLTSYTQYQPEIAQGFLQALFEYQSMLVELTGLPIANASMYDHATALGEAATLAARVRGASGSRVLVPELLPSERRSVLENYASGAGLTVESYPSDDGNADLDGLASIVDSDVLLIYAENPTVRGTIEEGLSAIGDLAEDSEALFCLGTDPVALSLLETPASVGADVVVGDAGALGLGHAYGMGHGLFVTREEFLRQVPGRLVGAGRDKSGRRAYTLTLQTREQHIRRERATSNICTNQAWVALRTAIHVAWLGPDGLLELAETAVRDARTLAERVDDIDGVRAPVHDRHHFREFLVHTDRPAPAIRDGLLDRGYAVHAVDEHRLQLCVTDANAHATDGLVAALSEVA
ncbi:aminomethyl-transferring glycine dehydrogenase subunit GcvPA [Halapricum hydrolyticum]|uniref:Aminomethyl-transferring glycine dehydrogenase subunit GcvPA n=1 Tax=Halapricum hydrolyticum TaxID=2979991 RepID=A0AAE3LFW9_9EURY|nr:aminomethyl-transferring glycine dehydrogenase subunit GcvPA [Halapricum hydrolyticum]MCU4719036.1 aminomethyl-transferring glycine dehydrogenase subunit GcvPA [Halapricum hydrolyticum]MCU4728025.1 aminomethyl-transferring glycine dehydrogenase subunit GcvPA [Halapricum hydrolyticum]